MYFFIYYIRLKKQEDFYSTCLGVERACVELLCVKKDVMEPFPQEAAALLCKLLKQTLMRVRWKEVLQSTIL